MKRLLGLSILVSIILAKSLSAQIKIDAPNPVFDIFLFKKTYNEIGITEKNLNKLLDKVEYVLFGRNFEINLEFETLSLQPYYFGHLINGKLSGSLVVFMPGILGSERTSPLPNVTLSIASWQTIAVIETEVGEGDSVLKHQTIYGLVLTESNGRTEEYKYRIIQPRTRVK